jgi:predicted HicB family RNase H-like nuclease
MIVEFSIRHTRTGVTATMKTASRTQNKRFVHTHYGDAVSKAEAWIREQRDGYIEHAKIAGKEPPEFIIPDGVDKAVQTRHVKLPSELWAALDAEAGQQAIGVSRLIQERLTASLLKEDR